MWGKKKIIYFIITIIFLLPALFIIVDIMSYTSSSERMEEEYQHANSIAFCLFPAMIVFGIISLIFFILFLSKKSIKGKDYCPICCHPIQYVPQHKRLYCKNCGNYI